MKTRSDELIQNLDALKYEEVGAHEHFAVKTRILKSYEIYVDVVREFNLESDLFDKQENAIRDALELKLVESGLYAAPLSLENKESIMDGFKTAIKQSAYTTQAISFEEKNNLYTYAHAKKIEFVDYGQGKGTDTLKSIIVNTLKGLKNEEVTTRYDNDGFKITLPREAYARLKKALKYPEIMKVVNGLDKWKMIEKNEMGLLSPNSPSIAIMEGRYEAYKAVVEQYDLVGDVFDKKQETAIQATLQQKLAQVYPDSTNHSMSEEMEKFKAAIRKSNYRLLKINDAEKNNLYDYLNDKLFIPKNIDNETQLKSAIEHILRSKEGFILTYEERHEIQVSKTATGYNIIIPERVVHVLQQCLGYKKEEKTLDTLTADISNQDEQMLKVSGEKTTKKLLHDLDKLKDDKISEYSFQGDEVRAKREEVKFDIYIALVKEFNLVSDSFDSQEEKIIAALKEKLTNKNIPITKNEHIKNYLEEFKKAIQESNYLKMPISNEEKNILYDISPKDYKRYDGEGGGKLTLQGIIAKMLEIGVQEVKIAYAGHDGTQGYDIKLPPAAYTHLKEILNNAKMAKFQQASKTPDKNDFAKLQKESAMKEEEENRKKKEDNLNLNNAKSTAEKATPSMEKITNHQANQTINISSNLIPDENKNFKDNLKSNSSYKLLIGRLGLIEKRKGKIGQYNALIDKKIDALSKLKAVVEDDKKTVADIQEAITANKDAIMKSTGLTNEATSKKLIEDFEREINTTLKMK